MKRQVFYSWQSDSPAKTNRNFIENCLKSSLKKLTQDTEALVEPVLDRDTSGVSGSPDIVESIFAKISTTDVFVADLTLCIKNSSGRFSPNPNDLIELGYAVAQLGWERIILVQNVIFGGPEMLPFDLRGRRIMTYAYGEQAAAPAQIKQLLITI